MHDSSYLQILDRIVVIEKELLNVSSDIKQINQRLNEVIVSSLKDHGERLNAIEHKFHHAVGWAVGAGAVGAGLLYVLERF